MTTAAVVVAINLGSIRVASKQSGAAGAGATWTALTLSSSFSVALPPSWPASTTASELAASSRRGDIWIAKAGSCLAEVETLIDGGRSHVGVSPELDAVELLEIADLVAGCAVWEDIGLQLRESYLSTPSPSRAAQADRHVPSRSYFLHHPDLSSGMVAPEHVPVARFQGLRMEVKLHSDDAKGNGDVKRFSGKGSARSVFHVAEETLGMKTSHSYTLRRNPRLTAKALAAQEDDTTTASHVNGTHVPSISSQLSADTGLSCLLDTALRMLIGVRVSSRWVKVVEPLSCPSLVEIAPAVWNLRHLQLVTTHTCVIPVIANGIARLSNAKSPSLREKVAKLTSKAREGRNDSAVEDPVSVEIKAKLWTLCQTGVQVEPIAKSNNRRKGTVTMRDMKPHETSEHHGHEVGFPRATDGKSLYRVDDKPPMTTSWNQWPIRSLDESGFRFGCEEAEMEEEHYIYLEELDVVDGITEELSSPSKCDEVLEAEVSQLLAVAHNDFCSESDIGNDTDYSLKCGTLWTPPSFTMAYGADAAALAPLQTTDHRFDNELSAMSSLLEVETDADDWTDEAEADYFYADGQGNFYRIEEQLPDEEASAW